MKSFPPPHGPTVKKPIKRKNKKKVDEITLTLSLPPSANSIWRSFRGRVVKSYRYCQWLKLNLAELIYIPQIKIPAEIQITAVTGKGWRTNRDIDNLVKPLMDLLKHSGIIEDDNSRIVKKITIQTQEPQFNQEACVCVRVTHLGSGRTDGERSHDRTENSSNNCGNLETPIRKHPE